MKTSVVFSSKTGNTQQLANAVAAALPKQELLYTGAPNEAALAADRLYIGFWTDKGSCNREIAAFLKQVKGKDWTKWTRLPRRHWTRPSVPH